MKYILILLIFTAISFAEKSGLEEVFEKVYASDSAIIETTIGSDITILRNEDSLLSYVRADLGFFPEDDVTQNVLDISTTPTAQKIGDTYRFEWNAPKKNNLEYELFSKVRTKNIFNEVQRKQAFPIKNIPRGYEDFLQATELIDADHPDVIAQASQLAQGEDDLFIVVSKIAIWVKNNIEYSLSSLTAETTQKASWPVPTTCSGFRG